MKMNLQASNQCEGFLWAGYKFVGDNIDKSIKPRFQRYENKGQSLHYFHAYAVRDRVDLAKFSDKPPPTPSSLDSSSFLPSASYLSDVKDELVVLVSR